MKDAPSKMPLLRTAKSSLIRLAAMLKWAGIATWPLVKPSRATERRLLVVYDFSSQPLSIGDLLIFQEASLILRSIHHLGKIDFALVYDPDRPVVPDPAFTGIDSESFLYHLTSIMPAAQVNPHLGSIFLFDSHRHLESFIADNARRYEVWPRLGQYASREYLFYYCFNELFNGFWRAHGQLPTLSSRPAAANWARGFLQKHVSPLAAVTVQLRRNPANPQRNSDYDAWVGFFRLCETTHPAKFVVICAHSEIDDRLRGLSNVIIAKDYGTNLEQDLALLEAGVLHIGMASGPATIVNFSAKPYCLFKWDLKVDTVAGIVQDGYRYRFCFATPLQNWIYSPETTDLLMTEFERMWTSVQDRKGAVER